MDNEQEKVVDPIFGAPQVSIVGFMFKVLWTLVVNFFVAIEVGVLGVLGWTYGALPIIHSLQESGLYLVIPRFLQ
jgi:hypothetical protein